MALFARRIKYAAHDGEAGASFLALLEFARKKGGKAIGYALYKFVVQYRGGEREYAIFTLNAGSEAEAVQKFWLSGTHFPKYEHPDWQRTSDWLYAVGVGGWYEHYHSGTWVHVCPWSSRKARRRKKPLQIGNIGCIRHLRASVIAFLEREKDALEQAYLDLQAYDPDADESYIPDNRLLRANAIRLAICAKDSEIRDAQRELILVQDEMKHRYDRLFPKRELAA